MSKAKRSRIEVQGTSISILSQPTGDYISLTDMVRNFDGAGALIEQWLKNKDTVLFLGVWERINNLDFNSLEFDGIRNEAGLNSVLIRQALSQGERLVHLNQVAITQMRSLLGSKAIKRLK